MAIQYNTILFLLKKLSGRSLTRIKLHVVVTSDQQLSLKSSLTMKLQSDKRCDPRLSVRSCRLGRKLYVSSCRRSGNSSFRECSVLVSTYSNNKLLNLLSVYISVCVSVCLCVCLDFIQHGTNQPLHIDNRNLACTRSRFQTIILTNSDDKPKPRSFLLPLLPGNHPKIGVNRRKYSRFVQHLTMRELISKMLRYGTCYSQGSHGFTTHPHTNHTQGSPPITQWLRVARLFNGTLQLAGYVWLQADRSVEMLRYTIIEYAKQRWRHHSATPVTMATVAYCSVSGEKSQRFVAVCSQPLIATLGYWTAVMPLLPSCRA